MFLCLFSVWETIIRTGQLKVMFTELTYPGNTVFVLVVVQDGRTALIIATTGGHASIVELLLNNGADARDADKVI